jgi:phosphoglycolate phosphatase-like HAD superfamily hydrolase
VECYVVTGGDQEEVRYVFQQRKLDIYFRGIYGSPEDKFSNLKKIISSNEIKDPVFFGDSKVDLEVAKKYNLDFIYIYGASEWTNGRRYCHKNGYRQIKNFKSVSF